MGHTGTVPSEPLMRPPYIQQSQSEYNQYAQPQLNIPSVPEHPSSAFTSPGSQLQASPVETNMSVSSSMSRHGSSKDHSPAHDNSQSNGFPAFDHQAAHRSHSAGAVDMFSGSDSFWDVPALDGGDGLGFSLVVPTMSVSAPPSAYPGSMGEAQQQSLMAPAHIPGKSSSVSPRAGKMGRGAGMGNGGNGLVDVAE